jgi:hypothetical protein
MSDESQLTPDERDLEQALRTLRPAVARFDPDFRALADRRKRQRRRRTWVWQGAAAAVLLAAAWLAFHRTHQQQLAPPGPGSNLLASDVPIVEAATVLAYRRAMLASPAELDALLDEQATLGGPSHGPFTPMPVALFLKADAHPSLGEL